MRDTELGRRSTLRLIAGAGAGSAAAASGCLSTVFDEGRPEEVYLEPPKFDRDRSYPTYGDRLPESELPDVLSGDVVGVPTGSSFLMTFFYSYCPTECIWMISALVNAEHMALERGLERPEFVGVTFDPERDTPEELRRYADRMGVDVDAGNWSFLRPESHEEAKEVVKGRYGVHFSRSTDDPGYDFKHMTVILLVNDRGYVERAYSKQEPDPGRMVDDLESLEERRRRQS